MKSVKRSKRPLSPHVCTRIYRPPEVALLEPHYDSAVDIWSLGCVLAELMLVSRPYAHKAMQLASQKERERELQKNYDGRCLFYGDSCYPLSPGAGNGSNQSVQVSEDD